MAIQVQAGRIGEIIRRQIQGFERNLLPLCNLSNLCLSGPETNDRMARTSKMNIILCEDEYCRYDIMNKN
jgi:hypothetical protein